MDGLFKGLKVSDHAKTAQYEVVNHLMANGFRCLLEYVIGEYVVGKTGRIDVIAINGDEKIAIEIDNVSPRKRSIIKLKMMGDYSRLILLRKGNYNCEIEGVKIISLGLKEVNHETTRV